MITNPHHLMDNRFIDLILTTVMHFRPKIAKISLPGWHFSNERRIHITRPAIAIQHSKRFFAYFQHRSEGETKKALADASFITRNHPDNFTHPSQSRRYAPATGSAG
jgi:hypothetical protein